MIDPLWWATQVGRYVMYRTREGQEPEYVTGWMCNSDCTGMCFHWRKSSELEVGRVSTFKSAKEAWFKWFRYQEAYPQNAAGWKVHIEMIDR